MCEWVKVTSVKSFERSVELDRWMDRDKQVMTNEPDSMVVDKEQKDVEGWRCCCGFSKSKESSRADETVGEDVVVRDGISGPCAERSIWGCGLGFWQRGFHFNQMDVFY